jgi:hypothetical protein
VNDSLAMKRENISKTLNFDIKMKKLVGREDVIEGKFILTGIYPPRYGGLEVM